MEGEAKTKGRRDESREVPAEFEQVRSQIRQVLQEKISGTEWRALGVDAVGGPMAQVSGIFLEDGMQHLITAFLRDSDSIRDRGRWR